MGNSCCCGRDKESSDLVFEEARREPKERSSDPLLEEAGQTEEQSPPVEAAELMREEERFDLREKRDSGASVVSVLRGRSIQ
eukprot:s8092_g2.t1